MLLAPSHIQLFYGAFPNHLMEEDSEKIDVEMWRCFWIQAPCRAAAEREPSDLEVVAQAERLAIPVIVLGEFGLGIAQSRHRTSYENWLRE